jgi:hypothetical protein
VLVVGIRVGAGMVDDTVPMIWWRIERIKLQGYITGIDDVVFGPSRDDNREARFDRCPNAIENRLTAPLLHAKELVELVDLGPDLFLLALAPSRRAGSFLPCKAPAETRYS